MTNKEAQRYIIEESCKRCKDYRCRNNECVGSTDCFEAKQLAIAALENQIEPRITNKEVLQLFAKYEPELLAECFEDMYCCGYNDCAYDQSLSEENNAGQSSSGYYDAGFDTAWLESEYDTYLFREQDVDRLLEMQEQDYDK